MDFKKLNVYKLSVQLYRECEDLNIKNHLKDQLLRASSSISLNLAESSGRRSVKDRRHFVQIAFGSSKEVQSIFILANIEDELLIDLSDHVSASLYKFLLSSVFN